MRLHLQETDSRIIYSAPDEENQTTGNSIYHNFFPVIIDLNIIDEALKKVEKFENQKIVKDAKELLFTIQKVFNQFGLELYYLPPLHAFLVEDGSLLIEWIFEDFRIGFSFEKDSSESSWYLVTNRKFGEISASGYLSKTDYEKIVIWLIYFILFNFLFQSNVSK